MAETEDERPPHRGLKKGLYVIPTAFTAANIGMGFLAVLACIHGFQQIRSTRTKRHVTSITQGSPSVSQFYSIL
jgi:hypothetical protein